MLNKSKVVAFVATSKPDSAKRFYEQTLGLPLITDDAFAIVFDANGVGFVPNENGWVDFIH